MAITHSPDDADISYIRHTTPRTVETFVQATLGYSTEGGNFVAIAVRDAGATAAIRITDVNELGQFITGLQILAERLRNQQHGTGDSGVTNTEIPSGG